MAKEIKSWEAVDGTIHKTQAEVEFYEFRLALGKITAINPLSLHEEQVKRLWHHRFALAGYILGTYQLNENKEIVKNEE